MKKYHLFAIFALLFIPAAFSYAQATTTEIASSTESDTETLPTITTLETEVTEITENTSLPAGEYSYGTLIIKNGATLIIQGDPDSTDAFKGVRINAENIIIESGAFISASEQGYSSTNRGPGAPVIEDERTGASHGGVGMGANAAPTYGSAEFPTTLGSASYRYRGGGAIELVVTETLELQGSITANAGQTGSGGSILLRAGTFLGNGSIEAYGGDFAITSVTIAPGGGGRIAVHSNENDFTGTAIVEGGRQQSFGGPAQYAESGTVGFFDTDSNSLTTGHSFRFQANDAPHTYDTVVIENSSVTSEPGQTFTIGRLEVKANAGARFAEDSILELEELVTTDNGGVLLEDGVVMTVGNAELRDESALVSLPQSSVSLTAETLTITSNARISADQAGFDAASGPGSPDSADSTTGASHGGRGYGPNAKPTYGSADEPSTLGSGANRFRGGGALRIKIADTLTLSGSVSSDGGGSSSGGSVLIETNVLSGAGTVRANGGDFSSTAVIVGPGGGGRVAVYYTEATGWTGTLVAAGGRMAATGGIPLEFAENGSVFFEQKAFCTENCNSSVLFLPGIKASRLYKVGLFGTEDKLWEPNNPLNDVNQLAMTANGISEQAVYTKDVIDVTPDGFEVYASFISFLNDLKTTSKIVDYELYAYDWRYDVFDIVSSGTSYENEKKKLAEQVVALADDSYSGKVTIVAHSNGGLLAKALLIEHPELSERIDKIVFVGSPQLGTPLAVGTILHGARENLFWGLLLTDREARGALVNFPGAYGLLPGATYLNTNGDPIITFDDSPETSIFRNAYASSIDSLSELEQFMLATGDGRPVASFTNDVGIANANLLPDALHGNRVLLDNWVAPANIEITEIVGVGLETISGFHYQGFNCSRPECRNLRVYKPIPKLSQYGDHTVIALSATGYEGEKEIKYINLLASDAAGETIEHANLTESSSVQTVIKNILMNETSESIPFVSDEPFTYSNQRVLIGVHSPVSLTVKDTNGNLVGKVGITSEGFPILKEEIVGSSYFELGDSKYAVIPSGAPFEVVMKGEGPGGMTFTVHEINGEEQAQVINIPIATTTSSTSIVVQNSGTKFSNLKVDVNGDGKIEQEITPTGQIIVSPPAESLYEQLQKEVRLLKLEAKYKLPIILAVESAKVLGEKGKGPLAKIAERAILNELSKLLKQYQLKKLITAQDYKKLLDIIEEINSK